MQKRIFGALCVVYLLVVGGGSAQSTDRDKPVWKLEFIKAKPGMFGATLGYLDDNWMRVREEAERQGAVLTYHRIAEQSASENDQTIVLLTEFKNAGVASDSEKLFASIRKQLPDNASGVLRPLKPEDLYQTLSTRTFQDYSDKGDPRFRLLAKE